jgi:hypothetical protein
VTTDRNTARIVGGLFIAATVAGVLGLTLQESVIGAPDYLTRASRNETQVATGALLQLIMGIAVVGVAVAVYPVLRRHGERLALAYVAARSIEAMIYVIGTIGLLSLVSLSRQFVSAGAPEASQFQVVGAMVLAERDWGGHAVLDVTAFPLSALILNYGLYRARLVPRWLSAAGLAGATAYLAAGVLVLYGLEPFSVTQILLAAPLGLQELVLAAWLIVRGFTTQASASAADRGTDEPIQADTVLHGPTIAT